MKLSIESTARLVAVNGVPARIWEGETDGGVHVYCYVTRIAVREGDDVSEFERELQRHRKPSPEVEAIPLRMIL